MTALATTSDPTAVPNAVPKVASPPPVTEILSKPKQHRQHVVKKRKAYIVDGSSSSSSSDSGSDEEVHISRRKKHRIRTVRHHRRQLHATDDCYDGTSASGTVVQCYYEGEHAHSNDTKPSTIRMSSDGTLTCENPRDLAIPMCKCTDPQLAMVCHDACLQRVVDRLANLRQYKPISVKCQECKSTYVKEIPRIRWARFRWLLRLVWRLLWMFIIPVYFFKIWQLFPERKWDSHALLYACSLSNDGICPPDKTKEIMDQFATNVYWWPGITHCLISFTIWCLVMAVWWIIRFVSRKCC